MKDDLEAHQKLIDIMFQVAQHSALYFGKPDVDSYYESRDKHMEWVAKQLEGCGFPTTPMGASWGVLRKKT